MNKKQGRPLLYNEPTTRIIFRVPISHKERIIDMVKQQLQKLKK